MKSENLYYDYYKSTCAQLSRLTSYRNKLVIALFFIIMLVSLPELLNEIIVLYTHVEPQSMDSSNRVDTVYIDLLLTIYCFLDGIYALWFGQYPVQKAC